MRVDARPATKANRQWAKSTNDYENMIDLEAKHAVELRDREIQEEHERNLATERMYSQMGDYSWQTGCPRCGADRAGPCGANEGCGANQIWTIFREIVRFHMRMRKLRKKAFCAKVSRDLGAPSTQFMKEI